VTSRHAPAINDILARLRAGDPDAVRYAIAGIEAASDHIRSARQTLSEESHWDAGYERGLASVELHMVNAMHRDGQTLTVTTEPRTDTFTASSESTDAATSATSGSA
jgi:hypothetical protein